jgi:hypothetical protein
MKNGSHAKGKLIAAFYSSMAAAYFNHIGHRKHRKPHRGL